MLIFKSNQNYLFLFKENKEILISLLCEIYKSEDINENSCEDKIKNLIYYYAAYVKAKLINDYLDVPYDNYFHTPIYDSSDWKEKFNYYEFKACLACKNIDFDTILNQL